MNEEKDMSTNKPITKDDIEDLIEAIKHPVVQTRPLDALAIKATKSYGVLAKSLRTVFEIVPESTNTKTTKY
jgi:hypothetical protein